MGLTPIVIDVSIREDDFRDRDRRVAPTAVGERCEHVRHLQRRHAERQPSKRLGSVAVKRADDSHLARHFRDRGLAEVGGQLRVDGVVGFERRLDEADRAGRAAVERFDFVRRVSWQPPRFERVRVVIGAVRIDPPRQRVSLDFAVGGVDRDDRRGGVFALVEHFGDRFAR